MEFTITEDHKGDFKIEIRQRPTFGERFQKFSKKREKLSLGQGC